MVEASSSSTAGAALLTQTLLKLSAEDDHSHARAAEWDPEIVELSTAVKTRIPQLVEDRCRAARQRSNCGLISQTRHAWASADEMLYIWDYRCENPKVLVVPADSAIVSVAVCPPRPGVFDKSVHLLLVICTRLTVSLVGLHYDPPSESICRPGDVSSTPVGRATALRAVGTGASVPRSGPGGEAFDSDGHLRLMQLAGYSARTDGALFHIVRHTGDAHILLACGAPQVYELAYSRTAGWFSSKCRLIRHVGGFTARVRDFFNISWRTSGRIRLLECTSQGYVVAVDDANNLRLLHLQDWAVFSHRQESVAMLEELAVLNNEDLARQAFELTKQHLSSRVITHVFPIFGLDGQLRAQVVTAASERLLFVCSAAQESGAASGGVGSDWPIVKEFESDWTKASKSSSERTADGAVPASSGRRRVHGFWLQQVNESRLGHSGASRTALPFASAPTSSVAGGTSSAAPERHACLEEVRLPCVYSNGVWVAAAAYPGAAFMEVGVSVRVDDPLEAGNAKSLHTSLMMDSQVIDLVEESVQAISNPGQGEPAEFRGQRNFAVLQPHCVQAFRLIFKGHNSTRAPATAAECCMHLAQLSRPQGMTVVPSGSVAATGRVWAWSFDDVGVPTFEEQRQHLAQIGGRDGGVPPARRGRWLQGLLRFLALVLRPVWDLPLVAPATLRNVQLDGLGLGISEEIVLRLLSRLRPALRFARRGLQQAPDAAAGSCAASSQATVPVSSAARFRLYTQQRAADSEGVAQARRALQAVLEVAERAQEVLGLLAIMHGQKNAYRVLQSSVLGEGTSATLLATRFSRIVESDNAFTPIVKLCTALVVESGLATPAAELVFDTGSKGGLRSSTLGTGKDLSGFASAEVCRDLEEQCPVLFQRLDLSFVKSRLGGLSRDCTAAVQTAAAAVALPLPACVAPTAEQAQPGSAMELLRRYAQCVSFGSPEDHWASLGQSLRAAAKEHPRQAAEVCAEKLQQLQLQQEQLRSKAMPETGPGAEARSRQLLEALLGAVAFEPLGRPVENRALAAQSLVEQLLSRTSSLQFPSDQGKKAGSQAEEAAGGCAGVSFAHAAVLDYLLASSQLRPVLEALLEGRGVGALPGVQGTVVQAFLQERCGESHAAGELLWRHFLRQGRSKEAAKVLQRMAERQGSCSLAERVRYLDQARQAASRGLPGSKELLDGLTAQLDAAARVQLPLMRELALLSSDGHLAESWRSSAARRRQSLDEGLFKLQDLYQLAVDFGLYHLVLVIADLSASIQQDKEIGASAWINTLLPPQALPYAQGELVVNLPAKQHGIFPLLMVRRSAIFLLQGDQARLQPAGSVASPEDLQVRVIQLISELAEALRPGSSLWDVGCVATVLEYSSCLWLKALRSSQDFSGGSSSSRAELSWVSLKVLTKAPFRMSLASVLKLYASMLSQSQSWACDLRKRLPADTVGLIPSVSDAELHAHLAQVILGILEHWIAEVKENALDTRSKSEFTASWPAAEALLADIRNALEKLRGEALKALARTILQDADSLEQSGRGLCTPPAAPTPPAPPTLTLPLPGNLPGGESGTRSLFSQ
eukprot:TRINITY_DN30080_c0_g2_i1.p1 TRINITY_DN30080_c0_g2~~TRINITY_DN30080_c0_g2_i1.p1  ORF type:complete len:1562 (+),score=376.64 TRINITY_DN30080_c0_g2_i1:25-4710(+)